MRSMSNAMKVIRIGFIGAGANTIQKHIPLLRAQPNVELTGKFWIFFDFQRYILISLIVLNLKIIFYLIILLFYFFIFIILQIQEFAIER